MQGKLKINRIKKEKIKNAYEEWSKDGQKEREQFKVEIKETLKDKQTWLKNHLFTFYLLLTYFNFCFGTSFSFLFSFSSFICFCPLITFNYYNSFNKMMLMMLLGIIKDGNTSMMDAAGGE